MATESTNPTTQTTTAQDTNVEHDTHADNTREEETFEDVSEPVQETAETNTEKETSREEQKKNPRNKFKKKGVRGVLVNLELDVAERFYALTKKFGSNPTAQTRQLIEIFLIQHEDVDTAE